MEHLGGGVRALVVAGRDRRAADLELADLSVAEHGAALRLADPELEAGHRASQHGQPADLLLTLARLASIVGAVSGGHRDGEVLPLEGGPVDRVEAQTGARLGEGASNGQLGHAEGGERGPGVEAVGDGGGAERLDGGGVDRLGAVQGDAPPGQVEAAHAAERPGGQRIGEVGPGRGRAAVVGDPLHPAGGRGHEVLRGAQHQAGARDHRQGQQPDQAHVVIQGEPGHDHVLVGIETDRRGGGVEVGQDRAVGQHHALWIGGGAGRELQHGQVVRADLGRHEVGGPAGDVVEQDCRRIAGERFEEGGQVGVHQHHVRVGAVDAQPRLEDELVE